LEKILGYNKEKIPEVEKAIKEHSFNRGVSPESLESKIVQDADRLEATGAIAVMRTFCSAGQMRREFYDLQDPFCEQRKPGRYALDLFFERLLQEIKDNLNMLIKRGKVNLLQLKGKYSYCDAGDFLRENNLFRGDVELNEEKNTLSETKKYLNL